jgi:glycerol-3-phosphate dehydrogenase
MTASFHDLRRAQLDRLIKAPLDLLVIGGGIVGSGVARDAAMRGLRVGLVDRHDFAYGTSSRSSRLLHGGLRYLEQGRIRLVRQASLEKKILRHIAPHLAEPLGFIFPSYRPDGRPLWQLRIGVKLYDLLCSGRNFGRSEGFTRAETMASLPALNPDRLRGSVRYFDALTNDARLVIDTLRSASRHGAIAINYTRFCDARREPGGWSCELRDTLGGEGIAVHASAIVNATGPWAQEVPHSSVKLRLTKGIHLVVDRKRLPIREAVVVTEGKRLLFAIPWGERLILGTTDTDFEGAPEDVTVTGEDVFYVLHTLNGAFPGVDLRAADIVSSWAGLRPLIARADGSPSDISRAHEIRNPEPGWWDITGGKLTTYRLMAEQAVDRIERHLRRPLSTCRTAQEPLLPENETAFSGLTPPPLTREAVMHFTQKEWAVSLSDILIRRSGWHHYHADSDSRAKAVARWMGELAGWSVERQHAELAGYRATETNTYISDTSGTSPAGDPESTNRAPRSKQSRIAP